MAVTYVRKPTPYNFNKSNHTNYIRDRGSVRCSCGAEVDLDIVDVDCEKCGRMFNPSGQELNPPEEWEEEY